MVIESLKIKTKSNYYWDDMVYLNDFDVNRINTLYLIVKRLFGRIEKIEGSSDRYLVADENNKEVINVFDKLWKFIEDKITFGNADNKISEYNKLRFSSDVDLPLDTLIKFHMLTIFINCVIEKGNKYHPEIYLDECLYETDII